MELRRNDRHATLASKHGHDAANTRHVAVLYMLWPLSLACTLGGEERTGARVHGTRRMSAANSWNLHCIHRALGWCTHSVGVCIVV
jgi:hypothetical protein